MQNQTAFRNCPTEKKKKLVERLYKWKYKKMQNQTALRNCPIGKKKKLVERLYKWKT